MPLNIPHLRELMEKADKVSLNSTLPTKEDMELAAELMKDLHELLRLAEIGQRVE